VAVFGKSPFAYQWRQNGTNLSDSSNISGSTGRILALSHVSAASRGTYSVVVSNSLNSAISAGALLTIIPIPQFKTITRANNIITFTWSAAAGRDYQLQYNTTLGTTNWNDLDIISATSGTASDFDIIETDVQRFYRVILLP
jgi:hypothetical protein